MLKQNKKDEAMALLDEDPTGAAPGTACSPGCKSPLSSHRNFCIRRTIPQVMLVGILK